MKVHLKLKGKAICGVRKQKRPLKFSEHEGDVTCERCLKAIEK